MNQFLLLALFLLIGIPPGGDASGPLADADVLLARFEYRAVEECLQRTLEREPLDPEVHWRLARVHVLSAEVAVGDQYLLHLLAAEDHARRSIALDTNSAHAFTWLAAALGYRALLSPTDEQLEMLRELLQASERAIRLNPADDIAYSIRGSTFRALGNVGWLQRSIAAVLFGGVPEGGFPEAEHSLKEAVRLAPEIMRHRYELAILMLDMGREEEAQKLLREAAALPVRIASDIPRRETIQELLSMEHPSSPPPVHRGIDE